MKLKYLSFIFFTITCHVVFTQPYKNFIGSGNNVGINVTASSSFGQSTPQKTLDASGMNDALMATSRFLNLATFGAKRSVILDVHNQGKESWLENQFTIPASYIKPKMDQIWDYFYGIDSTLFGPYALHFNFAWWDNNMTQPDLLRQKVAYALSQILVVSAASDLGDYGDGLSSYYDTLLKNAFGNFRELLIEITKHPAMGYYLSHLNNAKSDPTLNISPDENFAREIMQLFTIGIYQLNMDGTEVIDENTLQPIELYDNNDIKNLAKVFTGLGGAALYEDRCGGGNVDFGYGFWCIDRTLPMKMYPYWHEPGSKTFLGHTIAGSTTYTEATAMAEVDNAVDFLFNHPNTPPFICKQLIQRLVVSNPSPAYVTRVTSAFVDNGQGVRGDMKAVIRAILLDEEAQAYKPQYQDPTYSRLREPFARYMHLAKSMDNYSDFGRYWNQGYEFLQTSGQHVMFAPSVFNFYPPNFQPNSDFANMELVAPEFKIHNSSTSIEYINQVFSMAFWKYNGTPTFWSHIFCRWIFDEENIDRDCANIDYSYLNNFVEDSEKIINELDFIYLHGQMTDEMRQILRDFLNPQYWTWNQDWRNTRIQGAIWLIFSSPDYNCMK